MRYLSVFLLAASACASGQTLTDILHDELERNFAALKKVEPAPYYLAYEVTENEVQQASAARGALESNGKSHSRRLDITIRVGSPKLDNYHSVHGEHGQFTSGIPIPINDAPDAIRRRVWRETDRAYRLAAQRLTQIKSDTQLKADQSEKPNDFTMETPSVANVPPAPIHFEIEPWLPRLRQASASLGEPPNVLISSVSIAVQREIKYFVDSDGARIEHGRTFSRVSLSAAGKAADGMDLSASDSIDAADPAHLPPQEIILAAAKRVGADLSKLLEAPLAEPFAGPAILSGRAAGVFFHEIFGHRIEGHRQKSEDEGQTFAKSVGKPVLPDFLSIAFDPTLRTTAGVDLNGSYAYDDEGIQAHRVSLVENGILKTFLLSRSPLDGFAHSNGHGRRQPGAEVVSRQSNLIVESKNQVSDEKLRAMLIAEVKHQQKPYGLFFRDVTGGFTHTQRAGLQAFTVIPLVVYRVFPDGRPDELIRGVDIVGTPLASFSKIMATSANSEVFNGYCGAESGTVPVSAVSPALLVSEIEIQKRDRAQDRPPLLPRPVDTGAAR